MRKMLAAALVAASVLSMGSMVTACATNRPADEQLDDAAITAKVKAKLAGDPDVAALNIDVDTLNGVVTLSGEVRSDDARREAEHLARTTSGVKRVVSNIVVK